MGQGLPEGIWVRSLRAADSTEAIELLNEGDGGIMVRSSLNRDRTLRLSTEQLNQLADLAIFPAKYVTAPELVTR